MYLCVSVDMCVQMPAEAARGRQSSWIRSGVIGGCEPPMWVQETKPVPLQNQYVFVTSEPSLQIQLCFNACLLIFFWLLLNWLCVCVCVCVYTYAYIIYIPQQFSHFLMPYNFKMLPHTLPYNLITTPWCSCSDPYSTDKHTTYRSVPCWRAHGYYLGKVST